MARKRMIAPCIWEDEKFNKLKLTGRLLFVGLISNADDYGKLKGHPSVVKGKIFPFDNFTDKKMKNELAVLNDIGLIDWWQEKHNYYIKVNGFFKYQVQQKDRMQDSLIPEPDPNKQVSSKCVASDKQMLTEGKVREGKVSKDIKEKYLDFVFLTKNEHSKLVTKFGKSDTKDKIERLNDYLGSKGRKYKSHYHTILVWARKNEPTEDKAGWGDKL